MKPHICVVDLVSIGNELLLGNTINTNASWLAKEVTRQGGRVGRITTVEDSLIEIVQVLRESLRRKVDFIITTGGIGPTFDDMTLKAVARLLNRPLRLNREALRMIKDHYSERFSKSQVKLTKSRLKMAMLPPNGTAVQNPVGTAPALRISVARATIFCLPGVPQEAKAIFTATIASQIRYKTGGSKFLEKWFSVSGVMESTLAPLIEQTMKRWPHVYIKSHPRGFKLRSPIIQIHLSAHSNVPTRTRMEVKAAADFLAKKLRTLGGNVTRAM